MTNSEITKLYQDARFQARLRQLCRDSFKGNDGYWRVGTPSGTFLEAQDLESAAWEKLLAIPSEKAGRDEAGAPMQNYLLTAVANHFKDLLRVARARYAKMPDSGNYVTEGAPKDEYGRVVKPSTHLTS